MRQNDPSQVRCQAALPGRKGVGYLAAMDEDSWLESRAALFLIALVVLAVLIFGAATLLGQFG